MIKLPEPQSFCSCMTLRVGSLVIGIFSLIGCILNIVSWVSGLRAFQMTQNFYRLYQYKKCEDDDACRDFVRFFVTGLAIFYMVFDGMHVIMSSLLIHGIRKEKPQLFMPYLSWQVTRFVVNFGMLLTLLVLYGSNAIIIISFISVIVFAWILDVYFFFVIYAYKMKISREQGIAPMELHD